jgi:hypothetical protein
MPHILKNKDLEIHIDKPLENYKSSRFDWTGKITKVTFQGISLSTIENKNSKNEEHLGKGFYNEFGFEKPIGFEETALGGWFHKIGIGLIKKENSTYVKNSSYKLKPAVFKIISETNNSIIIRCISVAISGYSYVLTKEIKVTDNGFKVDYKLENTGVKEIITDEYIHNFIGIDNDFIGPNYDLKFPFQIKPTLFEETVNPEQKIAIGKNDIRFIETPEIPFFFSNLSGNEKIDASWELTNLKSKISVKETGNFKTNKVNIWGWKHVVSPELYFNIAMKPGKSSEWSRNYELTKI